VAFWIAILAVFIVLLPSLLRIQRAQKQKPVERMTPSDGGGAFYAAESSGRGARDDTDADAGDSGDSGGDGGDSGGDGGGGDGGGGGSD
jgi:hypothetical protein